MNPETIKALQDALSPLAQKLGEGAAQLYAIYVRQIVAEGIAGIIVGVVLFLIAALGAWLFWSTFSHLGQWQYLELTYVKALKGEAVARLWVGASLLLIMGLIGLLTLQSSVLQVVNPEYYAIDRIISTVRGGAK